MKILQVVGFKDSGKTTLISHFLQLAKNHQIKCSVIKHHGHSSPLEFPENKVDSMRFYLDGAESSIVADSNHIQMYQKKIKPDLKNLIELSVHASPDLILVEGYKDAHYPKIVLLRSIQDWRELASLSQIALVLVPSGLFLENEYTLECDELNKIDDFFMTWLEGDNCESI